MGPYGSFPADWQAEPPGWFSSFFLGPSLHEWCHQLHLEQQRVGRASWLLLRDFCRPSFLWRTMHFPTRAVERQVRPLVWFVAVEGVRISRSSCLLFHSIEQGLLCKKSLGKESMAWAWLFLGQYRNAGIW